MRPLPLLLALLQPLWAAPVIYTVCASGCTYSNLQTAINDAVTAQASSCGPVVLDIRAGETFTGAFYLPAKSCAQYITLRSDQLNQLTPGTRVSTSDATKMPKLITAGGDTDPTIFTVEGSGTGYWALEGLEITMPDLGVAIKYALAQLGWPTANENTVAKTPHHIRVDRSYLHGIAQKEGPVRCISLNARVAEVTNSYLAECKSSNTDSQAIAMNQSLGPVLIRNNYLEGAGENTIMGGGDGIGNSLIWVPGAAQRDLRFLGNYFHKKPEWRVTSQVGVPTRNCLVGEYRQNTSTGNWYQCTSAPNTWTLTGTVPVTFIVKNLFEVKDGQGVYAYGNYLENSWEAGQTGDTFLLNQSGNLTKNYDIRDTVILANQGRTVNTGVKFGNLNYLVPGGNTRTYSTLIYGNLFTGMGAPYLYNGLTSSRFLMTAFNYDVVFRHNTNYNYAGAAPYSLIGSVIDDPPSLGGYNEIIDNVFDAYAGQLWQYNAAPQSYCWLYDIVTGFNGVSLLGTTAFVSAVSTGSTCTAGSGSVLPTGTPQYTAITDVLTDPANGDFSINPAATAAIGTATDGTNLGINVSLLNAATAGSVSGAPNPFLDFRTRGVTSAATSATLYITAPSTTSCTVVASVNQSLSPTTGSVSVAQTGRNVVATITSLSSNSRYYYGVTCGADSINGFFRTGS